MFFASDNTGPVAPEIMAALTQANSGYALPYGNDQATAELATRIREIFEAPDAVTYLVSTGTAANALALATLTQPWQAVFCSRDAHINVFEANAPEFFSGGAKLVAVDGPSGKIDPGALATAMSAIETGGFKDTQRGPVSLTQVTDFGAVYTIDELRAVTDVAKAFGAQCHMDGARFANALAALDVSPAEMSWKSGIDALSFGGTKNGLMGVEAVIFFDPRHAAEFQLRRMRGAHLMSKHRFLAAQMLAYLTDDLWLQLASRANAAAARLEQALAAVPELELQHKRDANMIFARWPRYLHQRAKAAGAQFGPGQTDGPDSGDDGLLSVRLVCNWATTDAEIETFAALLRD